jgi:(2Fe-2S) ferredoxin
LGPTVVIYPQAVWYGGVGLEDVQRIIEETIIGGRVLLDLEIADEDLNNQPRHVMPDPPKTSASDADR